MNYLILITGTKLLIYFVSPNLFYIFVKNFKPMAKENLITIKEYAEKCGVSDQTIYNRINNFEITPVKKEGYLFIDLLTTAIVAAKIRGKKSAKSVLDKQND